MNEIELYSSKIFDDIKHIDEFGNEYWYARELGNILEYSEYRKFLPVINKAIISCKNSNQNFNDHFVQTAVMVDIGSNAKRRLKEYKLTRYACYLTVQNADSLKPVVALGQTYFAIKTRKQELLEEYYDEDSERLINRKRVRNGNLSLNHTAIKAGVRNLAEFHNAGYKGLYNGETANDIAKRKGLRYREYILDNMSSSELAANLFRITQTNDKLKREQIDNEYAANNAHYEVGKKVRETIKDLGGTMPEDLPTPNKSLKKLEKDTIEYDKL